MFNNFYIIIFFVLIGLLIVGDLPEYPYDTFNIKPIISSWTFFWIISIFGYFIISFIYWCFLIKHYPEYFIY